MIRPEPEWLFAARTSNLGDSAIGWICAAIAVVALLELVLR